MKGARFALPVRPARLLALGVCLCVMACASPGERIASRATELGFERRLIAGGPFKLLAFARPGPAERTLHVYIENDGQPWRSVTRVSDDPTPRQPLMLEAMALDPGPALYLGRPCYLIDTPDAGCSPLLWTHRRYSAEVVASMESALRAYLREDPHAGVAFFGHSGGGTLAVLLAERFAETAAVLTLAANLDVAGWARWHDYSPLEGSLDPMQRPALPPTVRQWHLAGGRDRQVPAAIVQGYAARHPSARVAVHADADHHCCWLALWPELLRRLDQAPELGPP